MTKKAEISHLIGDIGEAVVEAVVRNTLGLECQRMKRSGARGNYSCDLVAIVLEEPAEDGVPRGDYRPVLLEVKSSCAEADSPALRQVLLARNRKHRYNLATVAVVLMPGEPMWSAHIHSAGCNKESEAVSQTVPLEVLNEDTGIVHVRTHVYPCFCRIFKPRPGATSVEIPDILPFLPPALLAVSGESPMDAAAKIATHAQPLVKRMLARGFDRYDVFAEVTRVINEAVSTYDPGKSKLSSWIITCLKYAARNLRAFKMAPYGLLREELDEPEDSFDLLSGGVTEDLDNQVVVRRVLQSGMACLEQENPGSIAIFLPERERRINTQLPQLGYLIDASVQDFVDYLRETTRIHTDKQILAALILLLEGSGINASSFCKEHSEICLFGFRQQVPSSTVLSRVRNQYSEAIAHYRELRPDVTETLRQGVQYIAR